jgi:UTP:GlnB (protein PII) uridylyltransferase
MSASTATATRRQFLAAAGGEAREFQQHEQLLKELRIRLHYLAGRREDRLLFDHQTALAREFGIYDRPHRLASEQLMQRYYRTAKAVSQLNTIVLQNLGGRVMPVRGAPYRPINERFGVRDELLEACDERLFQRYPGAMLRKFEFSPDTELAVHEGTIFLTAEAEADSWAITVGGSVFVVGEGMFHLP